MSSKKPKPYKTHEPIAYHTDHDSERYRAIEDIKRMQQESRDHPGTRRPGGPLTALARYEKAIEDDRKKAQAERERELLQKDRESREKLSADHRVKELDIAQKRLDVEQGKAMLEKMRLDARNRGRPDKKVTPHTPELD